MYNVSRNEPDLATTLFPLKAIIYELDTREQVSHHCVLLLMQFFNFVQIQTNSPQQIKEIRKYFILSEIVSYACVLKEQTFKDLILSKKYISHGTPTNATSNQSRYSSMTVLVKFVWWDLLEFSHNCLNQVVCFVEIV